MLENLHFITRCLRYRFRTERLQLKTLLKLNLTGTTVLDIGANKGIYCFWLSRAVGPAGRVLAFEPQPEMVRYIEDKKGSFGLSNITTFNVALSDGGGTAWLHRQRIGDGSASLQRERIYDDSHEISVAMRSLDDFADIANLAFIKCDVEGHEIKVFEGGRQLIERFRPVVQFEAKPAETGGLFDFFGRLGYQGIMFLENRYRPLTDVGRVPHSKFGLNIHRDFLFFPPQAVGSIIPTSVFESFPL